MKILVDIESALKDLDVSPEEYLEMVDDLKSYWQECYPELEEYVSRDNYSDLKEISKNLSGFFAELHFISAQDTAERLAKSASISSQENPEILIRELKQCFERTIRYINS